MEIFSFLNQTLAIQKLANKSFSSFQEENSSTNNNMEIDMTCLESAGIDAATENTKSPRSISNQAEYTTAKASIEDPEQQQTLSSQEFYLNYKNQQQENSSHALRVL